MELLLSLSPVLLFLIGLMYLDTFKLVGVKAIALTIVVGCTAAGLSLALNTVFSGTLGMDWQVVSRYAAPLVEEGAKAAFLVYLLRSGRIGFMVDAAVRGFAIGAGFALVENIYFLQARPDAELSLWVIRGFGTAIMHGGTTAIVGILAKALSERYPTRIVFPFVPGFLLAVLLHSAFNHFLLTPVQSTLVILIVFPAAVLSVFNRSEQSTRDWLGIGFDSDRELLEMITSGVLTETRVGQYLSDLERRFPPSVVADMLCLLRLYAELSIQAKGILLLRQAGFKVPPDPEAQEKLQETRFLKKSIGKTGMIALRPFFHDDGKGVWQFSLLESR